jgi:putative FmdB family regulatory protein
MPIYEYRCDDCGRVTSILVRSLRAKVVPRCEQCDSKRMKKLISRVSRVKTAQDVLDDLGAPGAGGRTEDAYKDPRQIGRWVEKRFEDYGMELPAETRQMIDAARDGEMPAPIKDL